MSSATSAEKLLVAGTERDASEVAEREALRRFRERATELVVDWQGAFNEALPGNHSPAEAVLLAHLMTGNDGYKDISFIPDWGNRPRSGWVTSLAFLPEVAARLVVPFALEVRHEEHARQLALLIDDSWGETRTPGKLQREIKLLALGFRVLAFSEEQVLKDPTACRERIEAALAELAGDVLAEGGQVP